MSSGLVIPVAYMELAGAEPLLVSLTIGPAGLRLERADGAVSQVGWEQVEDARCGEPGFAPDGTPGVALVAMVGGRFVRFVVPDMPPERATAINMLLEVRLRPTAPLTPGPGAGHTASEPPPPARWDVIPVRPLPEGASMTEADITTRAGNADNLSVGGNGTVVGVPVEPVPPEQAVAPPFAGPLPTPVAAPPIATAAVPTPGTLPPEIAAQLSPEVAALLAAPGHSDGGVRRLPPIGGWDRPVPDESERRFRRMIIILGVLVAVLVVAAIVLLTVGLSVKARNPHAASRHPAAATLARSVAVGTSDLPTGWKAQATGTSPLAQLLPQGDGTGLAPGTPPPAATAASFASCLHRRTTNDVVVGPAGAHPIGRSTSQVFQSPLGGAAMGVATVTSVYRDAAEVRTAAGELTLPGFAHCLGTALGTELLKAAQSVPADAGATFGTLTISPLTLPQGHNVTAAGVDVSVPVTYPGGQTTVDVGFVLVAGGTVETTLVTYAAGGTFPSALSRSLAADLEDDVAASLT